MFKETNKLFEKTDKLNEQIDIKNSFNRQTDKMHLYTNTMAKNCSNDLAFLKCLKFGTSTVFKKKTHCLKQTNGKKFEETDKLFDKTGKLIEETDQFNS